MELGCMKFSIPTYFSSVSLGLYIYFGLSLFLLISSMGRESRYTFSNAWYWDVFFILTYFLYGPGTIVYIDL